MSESASKRLRLHGWAVSSFCYKVLLVLARKGVDYTWVPAPLMSRPHKKKVGTGQVPVLEVGDTWIADSTAIVAWLEEHYPEPSVFPADPRDRVLALLLEDWADESLVFGAHAAIWTPPGDAKRLTTRQARDRPGLDHHLGRLVFSKLAPGMFRKLATARRSWPAARAFFGEQLDLVEQLFDPGPFVFGDEPTIADFAIAAQLANLVGLTNEPLLQQRPHALSAVRSLVELLPRRCGFDGARTLKESHGVSPALSSR